jgi:hypothetical protein
MPEEHHFADEDTWRVFRIMSEFVEGFETMSRIGPAVSVFGSSRARRGTTYYRKARRLGRMLAERGYAVITGGGPGIMEAANRGAHDAGGTSVGLNITIPLEQPANPWANVRIDFRYFFARLVMFVKYAKAFVCFPGGFGTLHEFFNSMALIQTGKADRFPVILIGKGYWRGLLQWMRKRLLDRTAPKVAPGDLDLFTLTDSLKQAVTIIDEAHDAERVPGEDHAATAEGTLLGLPPHGYGRRRAGRKGRS